MRNPPSRRIENAGDREVHRRAGKGNDQLLCGCFGDALEARHTADRQEHDVGRLHAVATGGEDVAELMKEHAAKSSAMNSTPSTAAWVPPCA